ncbi:uncharacterized protein CLUP02_12846 [Colletotrichum lupini]|uniref:Uncharacterized protein n=1 Tax=Colletotrichum lupini TaxID=145971 RepID=A0A9Q8T1C7_9PEZI|nr:uncharacterized protein CLUP02_12846 [Colletotrichum lupini]UQC87342.1 hypothetical protein CLUP02_12846 [Colletotrichum lupini]
MLGYNTEGDGVAGIQRRLSEHDFHRRAFSLAGEDLVGGPPSGVGGGAFVVGRLTKPRYCFLAPELKTEVST